MTEETNGDEKSATPSMTRGDRVRSAARTLRKPRTASWVAEQTETSPKTAKKYLEQLVEDNVLQKIEQGGQTLYQVDQLMATYREVATLQREHDQEDLTDRLQAMQAQLTEWKAKYEVRSPSELRATISDVGDSEEATTRREAAREWDHLEDRLPIVKAALKEYDWATDQDVITV